MKKSLLFLCVLVSGFSVFGQDHYEKKYSLGQNSGGKWYKLMNIDLNGNGNHNSVNITVDFHYVNTWTKYNANAILRLRENSNSDWQFSVTGINQSILKFKKVSNNVYELWGLSNSSYGHISFTSTVTKEAQFIMTIPDLPVESPDISALEDVASKGDWYFPLGKIEVINNGTIGGAWNPNASYFTISGTDGSKIIMDTNEIYSQSLLHIGSKTGDIVKFRTVGENGTSDKMIIKNNGNVGIGTTNPDAKLAVNGNIHTKEVKVDLIGWADYVFKEDYNLPTLQQVEDHIATKGHLINIPSAAEVTENGIHLGEMNAKLLEKIEELTLYAIAQEKELKDFKNETKSSKKVIDNLKLKNINLEDRLSKLEALLTTLER
ncbi:hypothetical protein [uncultured Aquimarina sp.]|uniref:hypothetical protein n=1 Tax=uncultured Aquimarina sp. TaxID=575652 RepID=UPI002639F5E6|nr:hypothetical protein [uncultured Aquimarina sp.]